MIYLLSYLFLQEEQDIKALQVKNRKLGDALDQRQVHVAICQTRVNANTVNVILGQFVMYILSSRFKVIEDELRERVERLETRQATDDASLLILNRYWNQVSAPADCAYHLHPCIPWPQNTVAFGRLTGVTLFMCVSGMLTSCAKDRKPDNVHLPLASACSLTRI